MFIDFFFLFFLLKSSKDRKDPKCTARIEPKEATEKPKKHSGKTTKLNYEVLIFLSLKMITLVSVADLVYAQTI